jgi:hypothetical protein
LHEEKESNISTTYFLVGTLLSISNISTTYFLVGTLLSIFLAMAYAAITKGLGES